MKYLEKYVKKRGNNAPLFLAYVFICSKPSRICSLGSNGNTDVILRHIFALAFCFTYRLYPSLLIFFCNDCKEINYIYKWIKN